ncbi:SecDF P1 head subdomain-containing protein [Bailinhaonella thermotolerans]|uniref:SecDF P1 head subdomain domain-containing protein n=1 Tax=Bailinhaonella thermotolerans TaxID=1070861 RepID=A0A3A4B526_9ACTN|nr:hypothetical protein [Bailinhaonella thermotolerans]RJL32532.1 hypothetical protein D5H75_13490 [Bailinhaonella thermotolerans]
MRRDEAPGGADRGVTVALLLGAVAALTVAVVVAVVAFVLARDPSVPLGAARNTTHALQTPLTVAPVTGSYPGACSGGGAPDLTGATCYQLGQGITINAVEKIAVEPAQGGHHNVVILLPPDGRDQLARLTGQNVKRKIAIAAGGRVVTAATVDEQIVTGNLTISGSFTRPEAQALLAQLLSGTAS